MKEDDWSADTSAEAVKARVKALEGSLQASLLIGDDDSDEDANSPYSQLGQWASENRDGINPVEVYKKALDLCIEKKHKTVQVLAQALFTINAVVELPKYLPMFAKVHTFLSIGQILIDEFKVGHI